LGTKMGTMTSRANMPWSLTMHIKKQKRGRF